MIDIETRWRHFSLINYLHRRNIKDSVNLRQALCFTLILYIYRHSNVVSLMIDIETRWRYF